MWNIAKTRYLIKNAVNLFGLRRIGREDLEDVERLERNRSRRAPQEILNKGE